MMGGSSNGWWNSPSSSSSSSSAFPQYPQTSMTLWHDSQQLPESWSQLLLGGLEETEERCNLMTASAFLQPKRMENWDDLVLFQSGVAHVKHENYDGGCVNYSSWSSTTTQSVPASSPRSCVTTASLTSSMLDFSNSKAQRGNHSSECNSKETGLAFKKARVQPSTTQTTIKVRKEKLGDRITALHQLVSPFGKTDTASVLLEAIGYIRFLHSQIEALSSPYLASESGCLMHSDHGDHDEPMKDLRSRGLCLVPISFNMLQAGTENGADFWAPNCGGEFR